VTDPTTPQDHEAYDAFVQRKVEISQRYIEAHVGIEHDIIEAMFAERRRVTHLQTPVREDDETIPSHPEQVSLSDLSDEA